MSNFMSDSDALEVFGVYAEDIKKGKGVIAVRETSPATAAHGVGEYVRYNGTTYKVKSAISIGDSLILNTNIEANGLPDGTTIFTPETVGDPTVAFLDDLGDVDISNPQNGQVPTYNSTTGKFENAAVPAPDISGKADKVTGATNGNLASLDGSGNLADSGKKASDFALASSLGTAAAKDVPTSGNASTSQVVMGNDTRLSDARTPTSHNQSASTISAGTFAGGVNANATAAATVGQAQIRDIYAGTSDMTAGTTALTTGTIYVVYE